MTTVRDIMTESPEVVDETETISRIAEILAENDIGGVIVWSDDHRLRGMVTDRDITTQVVAAKKDPNTTTARDILAGSEVVTVGADDSLDVAVEKMTRHAVRRLPVIDGTDLVGIVSQADLAIHAGGDSVGQMVEQISEAPDNTGQG
jgi:CBS domain-containing protein